MVATIKKSAGAFGKDLIAQSRNGTSHHLDPQDEMPLSGEEKQTLAHCEAIIQTHLGAFYEVGQALLEIRDKHLYRATSKTFEEYCHTRFEISRPQAYRLLHAAEIKRILSPIGDIPLPVNESQLRPLTQIPTDQVKLTWKKVIKRAGAGKPTAALVREVVDEMENNREDNQTEPALFQWQKDLQDLLSVASEAVGQAEWTDAKQAVEKALIRIDIEVQRGFRSSTED